MENSPEDFLLTVRSGASGYVLKDTSTGELIAAFRDGFFSLRETLFEWVFRTRATVFLA
jgi:DNA-binding NarL/FixJ family response regulator